MVGGRLSLSVDVQLQNLTFGGFFGYRGGVPIGVPDAWEGAATFGLRLGLAFDVGGWAIHQRNGRSERFRVVSAHALRA